MLVQTQVRLLPRALSTFNVEAAGKDLVQFPSL